MDDYYNLLGVDRKATDEQIKKAYRKLAMKFHPDHNKDNPQAEEQFKKIAEAYAVLSNKDKRKKYDMYGAEGFKQKFSQEDIFRDFDINEIFKGFGFSFGGGDPYQGIEELFRGKSSFHGSFENVFGGQGFPGGTGRPQRGQDLESTLTIGFEEAALGTQKTITLQKNGGREETTLKIPAGINSGKKLRLRGKGGPAPAGGSPGDLYIRIAVQPHPVFQREGDDILVDLEISLTDALLGTIKEVPTLTGAKNLKIPPGTPSHSKLRLKGMGVSHASGTAKGDQFVRVLVKYPKELTDEQRELVTALKKLGL